MKNTGLICVAASMVLLAACTPRFLTPRTNPETSISVVQGNSGAFYIVVDQDPIVLRKKGRYKITWKVDTEGYTFHPQNGITVKFERGISGEITNCRPVPKSADREFDCDNDNTGKGVYSYTITVLGPNRAVLKGDPWIVND
jgi:hypothetical protein